MRETDWSWSLYSLTIIITSTATGSLNLRMNHSKQFWELNQLNNWNDQVFFFFYKSDQGELGWKSRFYIHKIILSLYWIVCHRGLTLPLSFPGFVAEQFLNSTATQLTYHGLCELTSTVQEGELCVFFRNNHFSTMTKFKVFIFKCYFCSALRWWMR